MAQPGGVLTRAGTPKRVAIWPVWPDVPGCHDRRDSEHDGTMARRPDLELFAKSHGLKIGTIADLIRYR